MFTNYFSVIRDPYHATIPEKNKNFSLEDEENPCIFADFDARKKNVRLRIVSPELDNSRTNLSRRPMGNLIHR